MPNKYLSFSKIDIFLFLSVLALLVTGILFIYSSGVNSQGVVVTNEYFKQIIWASIGIVVMVILSLVKYDVYRDIAPILFAIFLALVVLTIVTGKVVKGAKSWLGVGELGIQPSEFLKVATILFIAGLLDRWGSKIKELKYVVIVCLIALVPMGLILVQPDFGTAMVFLPILLFMLIIAGAQARHLVYIVGVGAFSILFTMLPAWDQYLHAGHVQALEIFFNIKLIIVIAVTLTLLVALGAIGYRFFHRKYFIWISYVFSILDISFLASFGARMVLKEFQMKRLLVFMDPYFDAKGSGWNIIQSVTAVGSGGFSGKGYLQGTQSHLRFLPEQSTDFIFSILSEEWGFIGCALVFLAFGIILIRGLLIAQKSKDSYGSYIAAGIVGMFFFHMLINIGMAIGVMPITGIPLYFLSYGGSSLLAAMCAVGILSSISTHRYNF